VALAPLRVFQRTALPQAVHPIRLLSLPAQPLSFVLDPQAGTAWVLDPHYHHDPESHCVDPALWPDWDDDPARHGSCPEGGVEERRGALAPPAGLVALAVDEAAGQVWLLDPEGGLWQAPADPLVGNPLDFLRAADTGRPSLALGPGPFLLAADGRGDLVLSDGESLRWLDAKGSEQGRVSLAASQLVLVDGVAWALAGDLLETWEGGALSLVATVDAGGAVLAPGVLSLPAEGRLVGLGARDLDGSSVAVEGLTGPVATREGRTWAAVSEGLVEVEGGAIRLRQATDPVLDLVIQGTGEVAVLHQDQTVAVYGDETALPGAAPLDLTLVSFIENPKEGGNADKAGEVCTGGRKSLDAVLYMAAQNRRMLADLPAPTALGIVPFAAQAAIDCKREADMVAVAEGDRLAPGLFFYGEDDPTKGEGDTASPSLDLSALTALLQGQAAPLQALGLPLSWTRGADRYDGDWVSALVTTGLPGEVLAPDLSLLPDIGPFDPRSKEPWPPNTDQARTALHPTSADNPTVDDPMVPITMRPGVGISVFDLGGCANLFVRECKEANLAGAPVITQDDLDVLALDLFRALAVRSAAGPDAWSFHLPALGVYDYTMDCAHQDRIWSGSDCQAGLLQAFLFDVQARYVDAGVAQWWSPDER